MRRSLGAIADRSVSLAISIYDSWRKSCCSGNWRTSAGPRSINPLAERVLEQPLSLRLRGFRCAGASIRVFGATRHLRHPSRFLLMADRLKQAVKSW